MQTWHYIVGGFVLVVPWIMAIVMMVRRPRSQQTGVVSDTLATATPTPHQPMDVVLQTMAARLGVVEADTRLIATQLGQVNELHAKMVALEAAMPSVQAAYESYADQIARTDKRDTERVRRTEKVEEKRQTQTAGEAAAAMIGTAANDPGQEHDVKSMTEDEILAARQRAGIRGSGGRGRRKNAGA